jgi:hypothetical protein
MHAAIRLHEWSTCWHTRELHFGQVSRVVFDWAQMLANEDYYQRRI